MACTSMFFSGSKERVDYMLIKENVEKDIESEKAHFARLIREKEALLQRLEQDVAKRERA